MQEKRHIGLDLGVKSRSKVYITDEAGEGVRSEFYIWNTPEGLDYMMMKTLEGASKEASLDLTVEPTNWSVVWRNHLSSKKVS